MKIKNKAILGLGTISSIAMPISLVVSCGSSDNSSSKNNIVVEQGEVDSVNKTNSDQGNGDSNNGNIAPDNGVDSSNNGNIAPDNINTDNQGNITIGQRGDETLVTFDANTNILSIGVIDHHKWQNLTVTALNKSLHLYYDNMNTIQRVNIDSVVWFSKTGAQGHDFPNFIANSEDYIKQKGGTPYNPSPTNSQVTTSSKIVVNQTTIVEKTLIKSELTGTQATKQKLFNWFTSYKNNNLKYDFGQIKVSELIAITEHNFHITFEGKTYNITFKDILENFWFPGTHTFTQEYNNLVAAIDA